MKRMIRFLLSYRLVIVISATWYLSGCVSIQPPAQLQYVSGAGFNTLSSNASISFASPERNISGNGYLMFRRPDQMRAVIMSPFGSVFQEVYVSGDLVTIVDSGNGIGFSGAVHDLPVKGDLSGWRSFRWLVDIDPPDVTRGTDVIERVSRFGETERVTYENGMLVSKMALTHGLVLYRNYSTLQGVAFPGEIVYKSNSGEQFSIRFEDPEINVTLADDAFVPKVDKLHMYPLSGLK